MTNNTVGFCRPIEIRNPTTLGDKFFNSVESYFHINGKKVVVTRYVSTRLNANVFTRAKLKQKNSSCLSTTLKIISYATIIFPLIMLAAKLILRCINPSIPLTSFQSANSYIDPDKDYPDEWFSESGNRIQAIETLIQEGQLQEAFDQTNALPEDKAALLFNKIINKGLKQEGSDEIVKNAALSLQKSYQENYQEYAENAKKRAKQGIFSQAFPPPSGLAINPAFDAFLILAMNQLERNQPKEAFETLKLLQNEEGKHANCRNKKDLLLQIAETNPEMVEDIATHLCDDLGEHPREITSFLTFPSAQNYLNKGQLNKAFERLASKPFPGSEAEYIKLNNLYLKIAKRSIEEGNFELAHKATNKIGRIGISSKSLQEPTKSFTAQKSELAAEKSALLEQLEGVSSMSNSSTCPV